MSSSGQSFQNERETTDQSVPVDHAAGPSSGTPHVSRDQLLNAFLASGEKDRLKELAARVLEADGWMSQVRQMARREINTQGIEKVTVEGLYELVRVPARELVPQETKDELMKAIKGWCLSEHPTSKYEM